MQVKDGQDFSLYLSMILVKNKMFNGEIYDIMDRHFDLKVLYKEDKFRLPVKHNGQGYQFAGHFVFPYLKEGWITGDKDNLTLLDEQSEVRLGLANVISENDELDEDVGHSIIEVTDKHERYDNYIKYMEDKIRENREKTEGVMTYERCNLGESFPMLEWYLKNFDNPYFEPIRDIYRVWDKEGILKTYRIRLDDGNIDGVVAYDYLLIDEDLGVVNGIMTPWKRNSNEVRKYGVGHYAIDKALDEIYREGWADKFSIGESTAKYKKMWETDIMETKVIGEGRQ